MLREKSICSGLLFGLVENKLRLPDSKRSQSAIELVILIGFFLFFFTVFFMIIQRNISDKAYEKQNLDIKENVLAIQDEINLASQSSDGYNREFTLPDNIGGMDYDVNITDRLAFLKTKNNKFSIALPVQETIGQLKKGKNIIQKINGIVKINSKMVLTSDFNDNGMIPKNYTCDGTNYNPPLNLTGISNDIKSFAIVVEDLDARDPSYPSEFFSHWVLWNITSLKNNISINNVPNGAIQGNNSLGGNNYTGPCPPSGTHWYSFKIYSLDKNVTISQNSKKSDLMGNISDNILDMAEIIGVYKS